MSRRYRQSESLLERAERVIPLGAQTFSKSRVQLPPGVSPLFASHADGARLFDVDGNAYLDFVNGLAAVLLGYREPAVDAAVRAQLDRGVTFSLSHELEIQVAEQIVGLVPSAEQVRFGKNGTDATSAAIRLARAVTGRDHVALCGYHGWQDWSIGVTTRDAGVPQAVASLSHSFPYGDADALELVLAARPGEFAAVIMEPVNVELPARGYLERVRALAHAHGALLIFDETVTGFRVHTGGAQALFGVLPDLTTLGKGLANGYPLSAVAGPRELMQSFEEVFFSGTFGGETLSLAAASATLDRIEQDGIPAYLAELGTRLQGGLGDLLADSVVGEVFAIGGHPSWTFLRIREAVGEAGAAVRTLLLQELFAEGLLCFGSHNLSAAHCAADIDRLLDVYAHLLPRVARAVRDGRLTDLLRVEPLQPVFRVRV
jgi:glutamate-1-semialdehyde 2,1-aminomutase